VFKRGSSKGPTVSGAVYGVKLTIEGSNRRTLKLLSELLPPPWQEAEPGSDSLRFRLQTADTRFYELLRNGETVASGTAAETLESFDWLLRNHVAIAAPEHVFLHAGAVAHGGRAVVIPGQSFSGKTTLVSELVRAGATYYSDEYAVIGADGHLHHYAKQLSVRDPDGEMPKAQRDVSHFGGSAADAPVPVGLVLITQYLTGADWRPTELTRSEAVLELLPHAFAAQERPQQTLSTLGRAVAAATALKGDRGDAAALAPALLGLLTG
jgi:hypothetical protein